MTSEAALSIEQKRIQAKKKLAMQKLQDMSNPSPVTYKPSQSNNDNIYVQQTGETIKAPIGTGSFLSEVQGLDVFDRPATIGEEIAAGFEKQAAYLAFVGNVMGAVPDDQAAATIANRSQMLADVQRRQPEFMKDFLAHDVTEHGFFENVGFYTTNLGALGRQTLTQVPNQVAGLGGMIVGGGAALAVGQMGPQAGLPEEIVTVPLGMAAGTFMGGIATEIGAELDQIASEMGYDTTNEQDLIEFLGNDQIMQDAKIRATKKGLTTSAVDAFFSAFGGKILTMASEAGRVGKAGAAVADVATQAVGEGAGEAAGRFAAQGFVDINDAVLEGLSGGLSGAVTTATGAGLRQAAASRGRQEVEETVSPIIEDRQERLDQAVSEIETIDFETTFALEIDDLAERFDILEAERDQISAIAENQIIQLERQQQAEIIQQAAEIKRQVDQIPNVDRAKPSTFKKVLGYTPESITQFIKKQGGLEDVGGELRVRGVDGRSLVGLVRKEGSGALQLDDMRQVLFDAGFFADRADANEITDADIYDAIQADLGGNKVFRTEDEIAIQPLEEQAALMSEFERIDVTPDMNVNQIADVLREQAGLPPFSTTPTVQAKTQSIVAQGAITPEYKSDVQKVTENRLGRMSGMLIPSYFDKSKRLQSDGRNIVRDFVTGIEKAIAPISTRVKNISEKLFLRLRKFEFDMKTNIIQDNRKLAPYLKALKLLSNEDRSALDFAMKNGNQDVINQIAAKYGIQNEISSVQNMLDDIFTRAQNAGLDINYKSDFFPRRVSDIDGLMDYLRGTNSWNAIKEAIEAREKKLNKKLTDSEKAKVVNNLLRGFTVENISLAKKGIFKERTIEQVTADIDKFYEETDQALIKYVMSANEAIAASELFGKGIDIDGASNIDESVGSFVSDLSEQENLSSRDARILSEILGARFNEKSMGYLFSGFRNLTYLDVMGSPLNALTQIGDLTTSAYNAGILNAVREIPSSVKETGQISLEDLGIDTIAQEFERGGWTGDAVNKTFKVTGFEKVDRIGKLNLVNSTLKKQQQQAKKEDQRLLEKLDFMFGPDADQVRQDLINGVNSENVKFLAFNTLMDMQPVSQLEMPEYYLKSGNMKILYMLKTFTIKQLDIYRREVASELRQAYITGNKKQAIQAMKNFIRLAGFWITLGATADYVKDLVRSLFGDDEIDEPEDYLIDNVLKAFGFSKYQLNMVGKQGPTEVFFDIFVPPTKFIDNVRKDFKTIERDGYLSLDNSRAIRSIPVAGELYYYWFGAGSGGENTRGERRSDL